MAVALSSNSVQAIDCGTITNGGPDVLSCNATGIAGDVDASLLINGAHIITSAVWDFAITVKGNSGNGLLTANDLIINNAQGVYGVFVNGLGATLNLSGNNNIMQGKGADTSILVNSRGDLAAQVNIDGVLNITNLSTVGSIELDGIKIDSQAGGNAELYHRGTGEIKVINGNAVSVHSKGTAGDAIVDLTGGALLNLTTEGNTHYGIRAEVMGGNSIGNVQISTNASISTSGNDAYGIYATGQNQVDVTNTGVVVTHGISADAIYATAGAGGLNISHGGELQVLGDSDPTFGNHGIYGANTAIGNIVVSTTADSNISVLGQNADAIYVRTALGGDLTVNAAGTITNTTNISSANFGIVVAHEGTANGNQVINFGQTLVDTVTMTSASAIDASAAIRTIRSTGTGDTTVVNKGTLNTSGDRIYGISVVQAGIGGVGVTNQGNINTNGYQSHGIYVADNAGQALVEVNNYGNLDIKGSSGSKGIYVIGGVTGSNNIVVNNQGNITHSTNNTGNYGIEVLTRGDDADVVINHSGHISGGMYGIVAWDNGATRSGGTSTINIKSDATVDAIFAVTADLSTVNTVNIEQGAAVNGSQYAVWFRGQDTEAHISQLNNAGAITASRDQSVIASSNNPDTVLTINNQLEGEISGVMTVTASHTTVTNEGIWNIQDKFSPVATMELGSHAANTFNNIGTINFNNELTEFTGLHTFNMNGGLMDLTAHFGAGTEVFIGKDNPSSTFIANGGVIKMDVVLGDDQSVTDRIYANNIVAGPTGKTLIYVNNDGGLGGLTNHGIQLIDVSLRSDTDAFALTNTVNTSRMASVALANTVVAGAYEYVLSHKTQTNGVQGWYLSSKAIDLVNPVDPKNPTDPISPMNPINPWNWNGVIIDASTPLYRSDSGVNIANQQGIINGMIPGLGSNMTSAVGAGSSGSMRAAVRLADLNVNTVESEGRISPQKSNSLWSFVTVNTTKGYAGKGQIDYKADTKTIQMGSDSHFNLGDGLLQAGFMAAYGTVKTESTNQFTHSVGTGQTKGYSFGIYGTWYANNASVLSPYIDMVVTYGRYDNEVSTRGNAVAKYKSNVTSATLQGGYPIALSSNIILEPQAQLTYLHYSSNDYIDHTKTRVSNALNGNTIGRIGTYIYSNNTAFRPYAALNVWYDNTNSAVRYNSVEIASDKKGITLEAKLGFQAQATSDLTFWGEAGIRKGKHNFKDVGGSVGLKYRF